LIIHYHLIITSLDPLTYNMRLKFIFIVKKDYVKLKHVPRY